AMAAATTVLVLIGAALVPDAGISVAGMWANRGFAIASIWIVALVFQRRIFLEQRLRAREENLKRHQSALSVIIRECLTGDSALSERLKKVCEISAEALGVDTVLLARRNRDGKTSTVMNTWHHPGQPTLFKPGLVVEEDPAHRTRLATEF